MSENITIRLAVVDDAPIIVHHRHAMFADMDLGNPTPRDPRPRRAYILNMYTEPEYRRQGIARRILHAILNQCRVEGFGVVSLHASSRGRPLYESLGFEPTNEMRLSL